MTVEKDWRALNRANWDERVGIHLKAPGYDLAPLRAGRGRLNASRARPPQAGGADALLVATALRTCCLSTSIRIRKM